METVRLRVALAGQHRLKLTWSKGGLPFKPYQIDRQYVIESAKAVRRCLKDFVNAAMSVGVDQCGQQLKLVAVEGAKLLKVMFLKEAGEGDANEILGWLRKLPEPFPIAVNVDARVHIPWGLVYDGDLDAISGDATDMEIERFRDFWCLKHRLSTMYSRITPAGVVGIDGKLGSPLSVIPVINSATFTKAQSGLSADERIAVDKVLYCKGAPVSSSTEFFAAWNASGKNHNVVYFYCHANGSKLALSNADEISSRDLAIELQRSGECPASFAFLNGCSTATGDPAGAFLEALGGRHLCGFIGTEAPIPDVFALKFGTELLREIITSGEPLIESVHVMQAKHWPLSLLYSVYCYPLFSVNAAGQGELPSVGPRNYSRAVIGSNAI